MSSLEYFRPQTIEEALVLLERGVPLAGGTVITPQRRTISCVIDLRELGLDEIRIEQGVVYAGATVILQSIVKHEAMPQALQQTCRLEAGWNIRNMATLGGILMVGDGRSPLLTALLALDTHVLLEPGGESLSLTDLLRRRKDPSFRRLVTTLEFELPSSMDYAGVARSPLDRPLVCAAVAQRDSKGSQKRTCIALGGYGEHPIRLEAAEQGYSDHKHIGAVVDASRAAYANAGDVWASAEYRSHVAGVIVGRLLKGG